MGLNGANIVKSWEGPSISDSANFHSSFYSYLVLVQRRMTKVYWSGLYSMHCMCRYICLLCMAPRLYAFKVEYYIIPNVIEHATIFCSNFIYICKNRQHWGHKEVQYGSIHLYGCYITDTATSGKLFHLFRLFLLYLYKYI